MCSLACGPIFLACKCWNLQICFWHNDARQNRIRSSEYILHNAYVTPLSRQIFREQKTEIVFKTTGIIVKKSEVKKKKKKT